MSRLIVFSIPNTFLRRRYLTLSSSGIYSLLLLSLPILAQWYWRLQPMSGSCKVGKVIDLDFPHTRLLLELLLKRWNL